LPSVFGGGRSPSVFGGGRSPSVFGGGRSPSVFGGVRFALLLIFCVVILSCLSFFLCQMSPMSLD
jgi:hypothetical protein